MVALKGPQPLKRHIRQRLVWAWPNERCILRQEEPVEGSGVCVSVKSLVSIGGEEEDDEEEEEKKSSCVAH